MQASEFEREITDRFTAAVNNVPGAHLSSQRFENPGAPLDAMADLVVRGEHTLLLIEAKKTLYPRDIPNLIWRLKRYRDSHVTADSSLLVLLAETISPGAREHLQAENVGYFDTSGSLFLPTNSAYLFVERPMTSKQEKVIGSVFDGRRPQVLEALWSAGHNWSGVKAISKRTGAAPSLISETLQELERLDWVEVKGAGPSKVRRLSNWEGLLDAWTEQELRRKPMVITKFFVPLSKPSQIARAIDTAAEEANLSYELTAEFAAAEHASALTSVSVVRCRMPMVKAAQDALSSIGAKPVAEGWNLATIDAGAEGTLPFREHKNGIWFASPLRTYLDLLHIGGRGKDAAKIVREQRLRLP